MPAVKVTTAGLTKPTIRLRAAFKVALLLLALFMVLLPRNRLSPLAYPLLFGVPLIYAAVRRDSERAFLLWTTYAISFAGFVVCRRLADDTGIPWLHQYVITIDRAIGFGTLPTLAFQQLWYSAARPTALDAVTIGFHLSYYLVPPSVGIILWITNRPVFERYLLAISGTYLIGLLVHFLLPTVPPWMAGKEGYAEPMARVLYDRVHTAWPTFYRFGNALAGGNDVAAMPSLHMATAALVGLSFARLGRLTALLGVLYALGMGFSLVYTGEHYVADLLGGILIAGLCWRLAPAVLDRMMPASYNLRASAEPQLLA
jgi:membrane-associated phospholipid phosphatase